MSNHVEAVLQNLVNALAAHDSIRAIALSGGERPLPEPGSGDLDIFVYCTEVPSSGERQQIVQALQRELEPIEIGKLGGGHWGEGDCLHLAGMETWLLYFTLEHTHLELEAILSGKYPGRSDSYYYPIGRLAMWKTMGVLSDKDGFLLSIRRRLEYYPDELAKALLKHHVNALADVEDLERAVQRSDIFFYHFALDLALDHFLQALFALNREYFPSRKRSEQYIRGFQLQPPDCERRLRQVLRLGGNADTLEEAYEAWKSLAHELKRLADRHTGENRNAHRPHPNQAGST